VIDLLSNQGVLKDIQELDFRGEEVVYRMKEG
jgi:predicted DNA-binding antitoxin AbrB/MazE fold protein